ncbi:MAG: HAMP domain-containing sensor histidine kinase [Candidatus Doudnabacteria bacterium]
MPETLMPEAIKKTHKKKEAIQLEFLNLTSHQLRTPLSGSKWLLELLQKSDTGNLNKKQKDFIEKLQIENERMIALVNDLLEVTRIEAGQSKLYLQPADLAPVIRGLIKEKERQIKQKKLQIVFTTEQEPLPQVRTEINKIKQVLLNLISNAISYTPEGGKITIDLQIQEDIMLGTISDTGIGIPKDQQKDIFTKFFRGSNVASMETTGTGLGLYICKAFIEASGGKLWFKSTEGKGTSFYFSLPIVK